MKKYITISREYGSGGHSIGKLLAEKLGLPFYDKEIIDMTAEKSGFHPNFIQNNEQSLSSTLLYNIFLGNNYTTPNANGLSAGMSGPGSLPLADQVFNTQREVIISLAKQGPCVIVGRCSDYILRHCEEINKDELLNIFIYAPMSMKIERSIKYKGLSPETAEKEIKQIDKRRANHYNMFTERTWGKRDHYDILVNSSLLGVEKTAEILAEIAKQG
ncbi:MAG: cytidylate kinase-like family protein [Treponema sp.]|nr:cytidylate kinase-like family protein [Treponema sp.]MEE3314229.1 cytidylate kinase-like family protein [Treponema sp.]